MTVIGYMPKCAKGLVRRMLPGDSKFWKVYAPVIRVLADSYEHRTIREKINQHLGLAREDVVLEEGCGKAVWLSEIQHQVARAVGVDGTEGMLKGARINAPRAEFRLADLNRGLPFRDGEFTKIASILVHGYLRNRSAARQESFRVLAPGGKMAIVTPRKGAKFLHVLLAELKQRKKEQTFTESGNLKKYPLGVAAVLFGKMAELKADVGAWHFYERDELIEAYGGAGFEVVACEPVYADQAWLLVVKKPL